MTVGGSLVVWCVPSATDVLRLCWRQNEVVSIGVFVMSLSEVFLYVRQLWRLSQHERAFPDFGDCSSPVTEQ